VNPRFTLFVAIGRDIRTAISFGGDVTLLGMTALDTHIVRGYLPMRKMIKMDELVQGLSRLAATHIQAARILNELLFAISEDCDKDSKIRAANPPPARESHVTRVPIADPDIFAVQWKGKTCFLGKTLAFKLFARLALRPNHFLSHDLLLDEVWECQVTKGAIRSVVKVLKGKLRQAGMADLATAIDGGRRECYGLMLDRIA
jgi:hypothetical protein